ncbi:response regulator transcription factor [Asticcacaulis solisilvae]|uniref:response regulator transcription factor n=1 Tax=Asticcacaulis solisilvae TaxID=1217274 RepID=UPI003FD8C678
MPKPDPAAGRGLQSVHFALVLRTDPCGLIPPPALGHGFVCQAADWSADFRFRSPLRDPDLIIVDFPEGRPVDLDTCGDIRRHHAGVPTIVLGPAHATDRILSLELGADDYLAKPFVVRELAARARAILRRRGGTGLAVTGGLLARWSLDNVHHRLVDGGGATRRLNGVEYQLLRHFVEHPFTVFGRRELAEVLTAVQERAYDARSIDSFINRLRSKLDDAAPYTLIRTERGKGYMFTPG